MVCLSCSSAFATFEGLIMPQLEATLRRFEEAGLGKYVLPEVQKKYMLRCSVNIQSCKIQPVKSDWKLHSYT